VNSSWLAPKDNCIIKCPGNSTEMCGGSGSMSVYHRGKSVVYPTITIVLNAYFEVGRNRVMDRKLKQ
jgi:hypothetical protein